MAFQHTFEAPLDERFMGKNAKGDLYYRVVYLPARLTKTLGLHPKERCRIIGELEGEPIRLAVNPSTEGHHFLMISKAIMRRVGRDIGDWVTVAFDVVDPEQIDVPDELAEGLRKNKAARDVWQTLSSGKQRIWTTLVERAKRPETRARRVEEVLGRLVENQLDPRKKWVP